MRGCSRVAVRRRSRFLAACLFGVLLAAPAARAADASSAAAAAETGQAPRPERPSGGDLPGGQPADAPLSAEGGAAEPMPVLPASAPAPGGTAPVIKQGEILTVERCVEIALKNHPGIIARTHDVGAADSRVGQARSGYYPQVTLSTGYTRYSLITDPANSVSGDYSSNAAVTQSIFEFGRTWNRVSIQQRYRDAAEADLRSAVNDIAFTVTKAYFDLLQAKQSLDVLAGSVKSFEQHLDQARAFFETGVRSKFDVTKAEVDLSNARLALIRGRNLVKTRQAVLNNAMGAPDAPDYETAGEIASVRMEIEMEEAVRRAYANRPELLSLSARREAAEASVSLAKKGYLPALTGTASYTVQGDRYPLDESGWSAGVLLTFPLFSGFLTSYEVSEARENFYALRANEESLRQEVLLDVQRSVLDLREAGERIAVDELAVRQAEESYEIARGRYEAGVGSIIEETDALVALRNARLGLISAQADYQVAAGAVRRAMGEQ